MSTHDTLGWSHQLVTTNGLLNGAATRGRPTTNGSSIAPPVHRARSPPRLGTLLPELVRSILDHLDSDTETLIPLDRRAYLSQESFKAPEQPPPDQAQAVANFRLTCRRFSELGALHQFARVTTRFSQKGFQRLENIAKRKHLAKNVRKFSYMVPYFYREDRDQIRAIQPNIAQSLDLDVAYYEAKINEQKQILKSGEDARVLQLALSAFTGLQHVQILPLQDQQHAELLRYLKRHHDMAQFVELQWHDACLHSTRTIGEALMSSSSPCTRFSSPRLSPQSAVILGETPPTLKRGVSLDTLAARLTCLELHFDDGVELDGRMRELSPLFHRVFSSAKNLEAVHVGFPSPLTLRLEEIFHNIKWERLRAFGIQGWVLEAQEIIALAARQKDRLLGLRLRDVLLTDGSMWKDVLVYLRNDMPRLEWLSLRNIGYAKELNNLLAIGGIEVPDGLVSDSDSDDEDFDEDFDPNDDDDSNEDDQESIGSESSYGLHSNEADVPVELDDMEFPTLSETTRPGSWCNCEDSKGLPESADDLGDTGESVPRETRKLWESWVVGKCPEHG